MERLMMIGVDGLDNPVYSGELMGSLLLLPAARKG